MLVNMLMSQTFYDVSGAAKAGLLKSAFFQAWHPDVLADYVTYGMYEFEGGVRLKCSGYQASCQLAWHPFIEFALSFRKLQHSANALDYNVRYGSFCLRWMNASI